MEQNTRNRSSFSNEGSYDQDQNRYNQSGYGNNRSYNANNDNDWNRNSNYDNGGRSNYGQDYGGQNRMNEDRNYDRWNEDNNTGYGNRGGNYGRSGSYSDWDFQNGRNSNRNFDNFKGDTNRSQGNYERGGYGQGSSNSRRGNYDSHYGSQDYGRNNRTQEHDSNRGWSNDRNDRNDRGWWDKTKDEVASWFGDDDAERRRSMDDRRDDGHRGKGPKNYTRSSDRIKDDISDRLSDAWDVDASDIDVSVENNEVTLSGTVNSKQAKRRAEDIADAVSGVNHVQNNLRVKQTQGNDWNNTGSSNSGSPYTSANANAGSANTGSNMGSTSAGIASSTGSTGTSAGATGSGTTSSPSNQVKIEKSSAS